MTRTYIARIVVDNKENTITYWRTGNQKNVYPATFKNRARLEKVVTGKIPFIYSSPKENAISLPFYTGVPMPRYAYIFPYRNLPKTLHSTGGLIDYSSYIEMYIDKFGRLELNLTDDGWSEIQDWIDEHRGDYPLHEIFRRNNTDKIEYELMEYFLSNGWTSDPDSEPGRWFITQNSIEDTGYINYKPQDVGWFWNKYAITSFIEDLYFNGTAIFSAYYFGRISLDDQRPVAI